ncbi:MAG: PaaI family thioesterase [Acidimicrobiales bacterium]
MSQDSDHSGDAAEVAFPLKDLLGFSVERGDGVGRAELVIDHRHLNPNGVVHGSVPYAMIDTAMGAAAMSVLAEGQFCATIDIHTRYLSAVAQGTIEVEAVVRRAGRRIVHLDASATVDGKEIVTAVGSFAVLGEPN